REHGRRGNPLRPSAVLLLRHVRPRLRSGRGGRLAPADARTVGRTQPERRRHLRRREPPPAGVPLLERLGPRRERPRADPGGAAGWLAASTARARRARARTSFASWSSDRWRTWSCLP